jgi:N-acetylneuraminate synthase
MQRAHSVELEIAGRRIGPGHPVYIVAEVSANHGHDYDQTVNLLQAAQAAGADAVKVQTYTADTLTLRSNAQSFRVTTNTPWSGRTLYDLYKEASMPWEWQPGLKQVADTLGLTFFSSAFDASAVDFLEQLEVPMHKIASFELVDIPLIKKMARTGKPLILSTGMATLAEIEEAVQAARDGGATQIALLKCTSAYPAPPGEMHLRTIAHLHQGFQLPVGLSDHTLGIAVPVAAVALGACVIEKHLTLSRAAGGPDSSFSLEPHEFRAMVEAVRAAEAALGRVHYGTSALESESRVFRRSLFAVKNITAGEMFTADNVRSIRPGDGLHPRHMEHVIGRYARTNIKCGTPLRWELIDTPLAPANTRSEL